MFFERTNRAAILFCAALLGFVLSKGQALVPGLGLDDYSALHLDRNPMFYLWQGRFTQALIQIAMSKLGLVPTSISFPVVILFFLAAAGAISLGILYVARERGNTLVLASIAALMASHPYLGEYFIFRESLITQGFAFALMAFVFVLAKSGEPGVSLRRPGRLGVAIVAMVLLAGAQQTAFLVLGFFIISRIVVDYLDSRAARDAIQPGASRSMLFIYLAAVLAYVLVYVAIKKTTDVPLDARSSLIALADVPERLRQVAELAANLLLHAEPVIAAGTKLFLACIMVGFFVLAAVIRPKAALVSTALFGVMFVGSILLVSISGVWWPVPRAVYGFGFAFALLLLLLHLYSRASTARYQTAVVSLAVVALSFHNSAYLYDQIRLNRWDAWVAGTIAQQLIATGVTDGQRVVLVGAGWGHPVGLRTVQGDLNVSALIKPWTANDLFMETTGRKWQIDSVAESPNCNGLDKWPSASAIKRADDAIYVCMEQR